MHSHSDLFYISVVGVILGLYIAFWTYPSYKAVEIISKYIDNNPLYTQQVTDLNYYDEKIIIGDNVRNIITMYQDIPTYVDGMQVNYDASLSDIIQNIDRTNKYDCEVISDSSDIKFGIHFNRR